MYCQKCGEKLTEDNFCDQCQEEQEFDAFEDDKEVRLTEGERQIKKEMASAKVIAENAYNIFKENFSSFFLIASVPTFFFILLNIVEALFIQESIIIYATSFVESVFPILSAIVITKYVHGGCGRVNVLDSYKKALPLFFPLLWISILDATIFMGFMLLLFVPAIIVAVYFLFVTQIFIIENKKGSMAFMRSMEYVKGRWWPIVARMSLPLGIASVVFILLDSVLKFFEINYLINIIGFLFFVPYILIYTYLLYKEARETKEPFEIENSTRKFAPYIIWGVIGSVIMIGLYIFLLVMGMIFM